jgi:hypothetical protein
MLISLSGKKRSGKSSVARYLIDKHGFVEVSWAYPLKEIIGVQLFGLNSDQLYGSDFDKERVDRRWGMSPREILQKVGTDLFRRHFMEDFWVRIGVDNIKDTLALGKSIVVSDTRFPNEIAAIVALGGTTIRMKRTDYPSGDTHPSETALDDSPFDYTIEAKTGHLHDVYLIIDSIVSGRSVNVPETVR